MGTRVKVEGVTEGIYCMAAANDGQGALLLVNLTGKEIPLHITVEGIAGEKGCGGKDGSLCAQLYRTDTENEYRQSCLTGGGNSFRTEALPDAVYLFTFPKMRNRTEISDIRG